MRHLFCLFVLVYSSCPGKWDSLCPIVAIRRAIAIYSLCREWNAPICRHGCWNNLQSGTIDSYASIRRVFAECRKPADPANRLPSQCKWNPIRSGLQLHQIDLYCPPNKQTRKTLSWVCAGKRWDERCDRNTKAPSRCRRGWASWVPRRSPGDFLPGNGANGSSASEAPSPAENPSTNTYGRGSCSAGTGRLIRERFCQKIKSLPGIPVQRSGKDISAIQPSVLRQSSSFPTSGPDTWGIGLIGSCIYRRPVAPDNVRIT